MSKTSGGAPATKADVESAKSELRAEIAASSKRLALEIVKTNARVTSLEDSLRAEMSRNTDKILRAIDVFAGKSDSRERAVVLHGRVLTEVQVTLKDHEGRLSALEPKA